MAIFEKLWKLLPGNDAGSLRCMSVSQDDKPAQHQFSDMVSIKVTEYNSRSDIKTFVAARCANIQTKFQLSADVRQIAEDLIVLRAEGCDSVPESQ